MMVASRLGHDLDILGPTTGFPAIDDLSRILAMNLFLHPTTVRSIVACWVGTCVDRPERPLPGPSFLALVRALASARPDDVALEVVVHEVDADTPTAAAAAAKKDERPIAYELNLFRHTHVLALSSAVLRDQRHWRIDRALGYLCSKAMHPPPFTTVHTDGFRGELIMRHFIGDTLLRFFFQPRYLVALCAAEFTRALTLRGEIYVPGVLRGIAHDVAFGLADFLETAPMFKPLSLNFTEDDDGGDDDRMDTTSVDEDLVARKHLLLNIATAFVDHADDAVALHAAMHTLALEEEALAHDIEKAIIEAMRKVVAVLEEIVGRD